MKIQIENSKMFKNQVRAQDATLLATERAIETLKAQGHIDPVLQRFDDVVEQYDAMESYRAKLGTLVVQYMRGNPPVSIPEVINPKTQWGRGYYEQ